jgi:carbon monoxide dehydrogenase subunit G
LGANIPKAKADTNVNVNHSHSIAGMLAEINSRKLPGAKEKIIDITPEEDTEDDD